MTGSPWTLEQDGPLAILTLANPPLNLFDQAVMDGLAPALGEIEAAAPRGLLVRADGDVVSAGVDAEVFSGLSARDAGAMWRELLNVAHRFEDLPFPTIFAAHALCLTAAFEISLACDLLVAAEGAQFGLVERVVGLTPAMGGTQRLAERAGPARAREFVYSGGLYDAQTLERWGVVNRVWPVDGFEEEARRYALRLAEGPTLAHRATKRIVRAQVDHGVRAADAIVPQEAGELFATSDLQRAVAAFLEQGPRHDTAYEGR